MTLHAYNGAGKMKTRAQPDSFAVTGVQCALAIIATMPHAYDDPCGLAHARMTQQAYACARGLITHAQRAFARSLWALVSRVVSNMCAMDNMVLILGYSCHAIIRAYELSARAAGATACMRVRVWPHGAWGFA